jgi:hypothetical protein
MRTPGSYEDIRVPESGRYRRRLQLVSSGFDHDI